VAVRECWPSTSSRRSRKSALARWRRSWPPRSAWTMSSRSPAAQQRLRFCSDAVQRLYRASVSQT
jgi:hypothetical protein